MASTALRISIAGQYASSSKEPFSAGNSRSTLINSFRPLQPPPRPTVLCFSSRRRERAIPSVSSKIIKKKVSKENVGEDENAADSLFRKLREVLKNVDDDISGEELEKLEQELAEALTDEELFGALESLAHRETKNEEKDEEDDDDDEKDDDDKDGVDDEDDGGVDDISEVEEELEKLVQELAEVLEDDQFVEAMEFVARGETEDDEEEEEEDDDDDDEEEDDDYEVKVVEVEIDEEEEDGGDEDDGGDDDINKLTELVEELAEVLEDDEILIKF